MKKKRKLKLPGYGEIEIDTEDKLPERWKRRNKKLLGQFNETLKE